MAPNDTVSLSTSTDVHPEEDYLPEDKTFSTRAIHIAQNPEQWSTLAIIPPLCLSTTFKQNSPAEPKLYEYGRSANPNRDILEKVLASLDGAKYGLCFSSGSGALTVIIQLLKSGDHVLCMDDVYGGTNRYLTTVATKCNISVSFYDFTDLRNLDKEIKSNTKLIWLESPSNPLLKVVDIEAVCNVVKLKSFGTRVVVDNTFLTPYFQKPLSLGADIVVYSLTKYMNGHSDVVMGAVVTNDDEIYEGLKYLQNASGIVPSPFDCYLVNRSLKTLKIRMKEHMRNGLKIAKFLEAHPKVVKVIHPGLKSHPQYSIFKRQSSGYSGMLSFYIRGGLDETKKFLKNLKYFVCAESLGGFESLAEIPSIMTHAAVSPEQRKILNITDNLVRLSVGLEGVEDLLEDLKIALSTT